MLRTTRGAVRFYTMPPRKRKEPEKARKTDTTKSRDTEEYETRKCSPERRRSPRKDYSVQSTPGSEKGSRVIYTKRAKLALEAE